MRRVIGVPFTELDEVTSTLPNPHVCFITFLSSPLLWMPLLTIPFLLKLLWLPQYQVPLYTISLQTSVFSFYVSLLGYLHLANLT